MKLFHKSKFILTQHESVVDDSAEKVGGDEDDWPGHVLQEHQHRELYQDQRDHLPFERMIDAKELLNLRIFFCEKSSNLASTLT